MSIEKRIKYVYLERGKNMFIENRVKICLNRAGISGSGLVDICRTSKYMI